MKKLLMLSLAVAAVGAFHTVSFPARSVAQDAAAQDKTGQQLLDEAEELKLKAETIVQQKEVIDLLEKALAKGLDESNTAYAKQLLVDALYKRAERLVSQGGRFGIGRGIREEATTHLKRAIELDPKFVDGYVMLSGLAMQGRRGATAEGREWIDKAVTAAEALVADGKEDAKPKLAAALLRRSVFRDKEEERLADLEAAQKADENNVEILMQLAQYWSQKQDSEKTTAFLKKIVEIKPDNLGAIELLSESLIKGGKLDEARELAAKIIESHPDNAVGYYIRGKANDTQAGGLKEDDKEAERKKLYDSAAADYTEAINRADRPEVKLKIQIERAEAYLSADKVNEARADIKAILAVAPGFPQAILLRSFASAREKKFAEAIEDLKEVIDSVDAGPSTIGLQLQLGSYYVADKRPRKAVEIFTNLLDEGIEDQELKTSALRARADAYLAYGKHADAMKDYEEALKINPNDSGILNNLAWVLATSPEDKIRNGERSIELSLKACELTNYKASHILSTLAAGYAEKGDFETAIKWSSKAVEIGGNGENDEQLKQELESYKQKKPWREQQETEEKKGSSKPDDNDL